MLGVLMVLQLSSLLLWSETLTREADQDGHQKFVMFKKCLSGLSGYFLSPERPWPAV